MLSSAARMAVKYFLLNNKAMGTRTLNAVDAFKRCSKDFSIEDTRV